MKLFFIFLICTLTLDAAENEKIVVAADPAGFVVLLKPHGGTILRDTGTVVMLDRGSIWITHRQKPTSAYPSYYYSIVSVEKLK